MLRAGPELPEPGPIEGDLLGLEQAGVPTEQGKPLRHEALAGRGKRHRARRTGQLYSRYSQIQHLEITLLLSMRI